MKQHHINHIKGMRVFLLVWFGQMVSTIGSGLSNFALDVWVYQQTGSVTQFALAFLFSSLPPLLLIPFAGSLADRWNRRYCMIISDSGAGLSMLAIAILLFTGKLAVWHIYIAVAFSSGFSSLQWPAYTAAIPQLVSTENLARANGLTQLADAMKMLLPPILGGALLMSIQLQGVLLIDFITFLISIFTLSIVRFPHTRTTDPAQTDRSSPSMFAEFIEGLKYVRARPGLLGLILFFAAANFFLSIISVLLTPLILSFTTPAMLGQILFIDGIGMLLSTLLISTRGGPTQLVRNILGFQLLSGLCIAATGWSRSIPLVALSAFIFAFGSPIVNCCSQVLLQRKVAQEVQGRVFALEGMMINFLQPIAYIMAGPLADRVFEPLMAVDGALAGTIGQIIGVGSGRGMGLMFVIVGGLSMLLPAIAYQYPRLRFVEVELADQVN
jgi:MFS transporter, DHA3 family, macrolide efflux protein